MAVKFETVKVGDVLFRVSKHRMGNTKMMSAGCDTAKVISIDAEKRTAEVSINGNPARTVSARNFKNYRRSKPEFRETFTGKKVLITKNRKL